MNWMQIIRVQKISTGEYFYETFTYTITDEAGQTATAQITIRIEGVNDAPMLLMIKKL